MRHSSRHHWLAVPAGILNRTLMAIALCTAALAVEAASFDCNKARTKLNRMICADPALSALDSQVGDAYHARVSGASVARYAHLRERHGAWRRQRGLYERTVDALKEDYQRQLAWLTHPLLTLEGHYEHDDDLAVQVEVDTDAPAHVSLQGSVRTSGLVRHAFAWMPPAPGEAPNHVVPAGADAQARPALALTARTATFSATFAPAFIGAPPAPVQDCRLDITFGEDELTLLTHGACGAAFSGRYRKRVAATAWGGQ